MPFIYSFILACFLFLQPLKAQVSDKEKSFYAIASLCYHIQSFDEPPDDDVEIIPFTPEEVAHLWSVAENDNSDEVLQAKHAYYENCLPSAEYLLTKKWTELTQEFLKGPNEDLIEAINVRAGSDEDEIRPYLLPPSHPKAQALERIFRNQSRPLKDIDSYQKAGFIVLHKQPVSHIIVAKHPLLEGFLVKNYLDSEKRKREDLPGWKWLVRRCQGAENIRKLAAKKQFKHITVPDKYLYVINPRINHYSLSARQKVILLVTDMQLVSHSESKKAWKTKVTPSVLYELYQVFSHGYSSTWLANNIPYTKNGTFSCIDTEYPKRKLKYSHARRYLSDEMKLHWDELVKKGGNL